MQKKHDSKTQQVILDAAEQLFLDKGLAAARMTEIADLAGVNHALLHYYFRSKENLFNTVFEQKALLLAGSFAAIIEKEMPFFDKIRLAVEAHFDFLAAHPQLPLFILREIIASEEKKQMVQRIIVPKIATVLYSLKTAIQEEAGKGTIAPIDPLDLVFNVVSLNVFAFVLAQALTENGGSLFSNETNLFLQHRKENNVQLIIKGLKIS